MAVLYVFRILLDVDRFIAMEISITVLYQKYIAMQMVSFRVVNAPFTGYKHTDLNFQVLNTTALKYF